MKTGMNKLRTGLFWAALLGLMGVAMLAATNKSYGQLIAQENLLSMHHANVVFYTNDYMEESSGIEEWMIVPFQSTFMEEALSLESWMIVPFANEIEEEELIVESWMTVPFAAKEGQGI